jgi:hypothetical protein
MLTERCSALILTGNNCQSRDHGLVYVKSSITQPINFWEAYHDVIPELEGFGGAKTHSDRADSVGPFNNRREKRLV